MKKRYLAAHGPAAFQVEESGPNVSARQFYLKDLSDNLVRPMDELHVREYSQGSGSELDDKMKALRSSSAMTFNILGNRRCVVTFPGELLYSKSYAIKYEHQLPTLKSGLPANLDALLQGDAGDIIACEMKMLEWLTSAPPKLKDKYLHPSSYSHADTAPVFVEVARELNASNAFTHYDSAQMFKHALALYNACRSGALEAERLTLLNCVWEPPLDYDVSAVTATWLEESTSSEHAGFQEFERLMQPVKSLFCDSCEVDFEIRYLPAAELIESLEHSIYERKMLNRYKGS